MHSEISREDQVRLFFFFFKEEHRTVHTVLFIDGVRFLFVSFVDSFQTTVGNENNRQRRSTRTDFFLHTNKMIVASYSSLILLLSLSIISIESQTSFPTDTEQCRSMRFFFNFDTIRWSIADAFFSFSLFEIDLSKFYQMIENSVIRCVDRWRSTVYSLPDNRQESMTRKILVLSVFVIWLNPRRKQKESIVFWKYVRKKLSKK